MIKINLFYLLFKNQGCYICLTTTAYQFHYFNIVLFYHGIEKNQNFTETYNRRLTLLVVIMKTISIFLRSLYSNFGFLFEHVIKRTSVTSSDLTTPGSTKNV
jgi:hypothetical protein